MVNTHVTSPGATVALGLMYLKTNDMWVEQSRSCDCHVIFTFLFLCACSSVARRLDAPNTLFELDCIRPDFMILRVSEGGREGGAEEGSEG